MSDASLSIMHGPYLGFDDGVVVSVTMPGGRAIQLHLSELAFASTLLTGGVVLARVVGEEAGEIARQWNEQQRGIEEAAGP